MIIVQGIDEHYMELKKYHKKKITKSQEKERKDSPDNTENGH